jgi:flagellar biosynthesis activator protein FlaF
MSSAAAQAYARIANTTTSPRDIEAQALLMAANKLQAVMTNADATFQQTSEALMFNRKLWSIFLSEAQRDENPQPLDVRQNIANIGIFVLTQCTALQHVRQVEHLQSLIDINRNIAAGLSGRP